MKKIIILLGALILLGSCNRKTDCSNLVCLAVFVEISLQTVDGNNQGVEVNSIKATNLRTGKVYEKIKKSDYTINGEVVYIIVDDGDKLDFSDSGDNLTIDIVSKTNKTYSFSFIIAGGKCACGIRKISGPDKVMID